MVEEELVEHGGVLHKRMHHLLVTGAKVYADRSVRHTRCSAPYWGRVKSLQWMIINRISSGTLSIQPEEVCQSVTCGYVQDRLVLLQALTLLALAAHEWHEGRVIEEQDMC